MPIRDGRWVSREKLAAEKAAEKAAEAEATPEVEDEEPKAKARKPRRSRKAAEAAISNATGEDVSLDAEPTGDTSEPGDGQEDE